MSITIKTFLEPLSMMYFQSYSIPDVLDIFEFTPQGTQADGPWYQMPLDRVTKSEYLKIHPSLYSIGGDDSIYPTGITADLRTTPDGSRGSVITNLSDGNSPYIEGPEYMGQDSSMNNLYSNGESVSFKFWDPSTETYRPVELSYKVRDDFTTTLIVPAHEAGGISYPYREVAIPGYYAIYEGNTPSPTNPTRSKFLKYADLYYSQGNRSWAAGYFNPATTTYWYLTPNNTATYDETQSIATVSNTLRSPFASLIEVLEAFIRPDSTYPDRRGNVLWSINGGIPGRLYPTVVTPQRNFDDPNKNWVGVLRFCSSVNPYGSLFGGGTVQQSSQYSSWHDTCTVTNRADVIDWCDYNYIPEAWAPFGSWKVLLDDTFEVKSQSYSQRYHPISTATNVTF